VSDKLDPMEVSEIANNHVKERLQTINGVSEVAIWGEKRPTVRLWIDPVRLQALGVSGAEMSAALKKGNLELPSGSIEGSETTLSIRTLGRILDPKAFENIAVKDTTLEKNDAPDLLYILYKTVIMFDHFNNQMKIIELLSDGESDSIAATERLLNKSNIQAFSFHPVGEATSTLTDEEYKANVRKGIQNCLRGDVFQIVLSRRFIQRFEGDDFKLYRALRSINPSPYLFYFDFGGFRIFGSSPETHCRIEEGKAYIDPIAGTTKRTGDKEQDEKNAIFLRNDPKENAEHVMLVDLARNDLSRNCHNVKVDFYKDMQYYSHVIHLVSRVSGQLDEGADPIKAFIDTFPAGTLSGAPKVRAMQLISEYEPHNRGAYGGCIGFIGLNKNLNQAITIRSFVSRNGELWFQAGAGIVAKSNDEYELQEVNSKLGALKKAILMAENM
jgi:anthranilate synthase component 1